jgi:hypothetical protein
MGKGITLTRDEAIKLQEFLAAALEGMEKA